MTAAIPLHDLVRDLALFLPDLEVKPLPEDTAAYPGPKVWFDKQVAMPDEWPLFIRPDQLEGREPPGYVARLHGGMLRWLTNRGWGCIAGDGPCYMLVPLETVEAAEAAAKRAAEEQGQGGEQAGGQ